jgi:hypothetical protein
MSIQIILIPIATGLVIASVTAMINIKIKFAKSAEEAKRDIASIFLKIIFWPTQAYLAWSLYSQFTSSEPLTRTSLFLMLISAFGLFHGYMIYLFNLTLGLIRDQHDFQKTHVDAYMSSTKEIISVVQNLPCIKDKKDTSSTA